MERHFHEELGALKRTLCDMGSLAETMISESVRGLVEQDSAPLAKIREQENHMDQLQVQIDEACCRLLALHQPTAGDLRFLLGVVKINGEIERLGDKAVNIAKMAAQLMQGPPLKLFEIIPEMVAIATEMVRESIQAFVDLDVHRAGRVIRRDEALDKLNAQVFTGLVHLMQEDREASAPAVRLIIVARSLERIGDHASNIAEDVIFVAEGKDVRHQASTEG